MPAPVGITPEMFGAKGDGATDDAPALQRAIAAAAVTGGGHVVVVLQPRIAYRCDSGLEIDCSRVSLWGQGLLDFSRHRGTCIRVNASSVAAPLTPANNYGHRGTIGGTLRLKGGGRGRTACGLRFDADATATAAQLLVENLSISGCDTGVQFARRAYNNVFVRCDIFECGICIDWPEAEDNGEHNTLVGCTLFNSVLALRVSQPNAWLQLLGCSLDYTEQLFDVRGGHVLATSCNIESDIWKDRPIRCSGDGGVIRLDGGTIVSQTTRPQLTYLVDVGKGSVVELTAMFAANLLLRTADDTSPATWATGEGAFRMTGSQSFDLSATPARLHVGQTCLSDPDFRSARWEDCIWRIADTAPIIGRYGDKDSNLTLGKAGIGDDRGLIAAKSFGSSSPAAFVLIMLPVMPGEAVLAGFRVCRDPRRPGADGTVYASPSWVRIDGQDEHRVPIIVRQDVIGTQSVTPPTDRAIAVWPMPWRSQRTAPRWATHFCMVIDLSKAHQASFLFNGLWADTV